jgi:hypothetical protein
MKMISVLVIGLFIFSFPVHAKLSTSTVHVVLTIDETSVYVNGEAFQLDAPAVVVDGKTYVPLKFLSERFGVRVAFDAVAQIASIRFLASDVAVSLPDQTMTINGFSSAMTPTFRVIQNRLMVQLTWFGAQLGAKIAYEPFLRRIEMVMTPLPIDARVNVQAKPVAKFTLGKPTYRIGERIKYIDLSYDPDGDGIASTAWKNNQPVFFAPGSYEVTLQVTDSKGNTSDVYRRAVVVTAETVRTPLEYAMHEARLQTTYKFASKAEREMFVQAQKLPVTVTQRTDRKLLVSDSPENVTEYGLLYRDVVNGRGRLYANHINETDERLQLAIVATNEGTAPVTIRTTRQGEVWPSVYANLIGHQATVDFLLDDVYKDNVVVGAGQSVAYAIMPDFLPGQGVNLMYDVETTGQVTFSFVAMLPGDAIDDIGTYRPLPYDRHVRGSFMVSHIDWDIDASGTGLRAITIGDNKRDVFVTGYDVFRQMDVVNFGNYGVVYTMRIRNTGKVAIGVLARGGPFKGPFLINGEIVLAPRSGIVTPFDGLTLLARTEGDEPYVDIVFSPPAGSAFPIDLVLFPLK